MCASTLNTREKGFALSGWSVKPFAHGITAAVELM